MILAICEQANLQMWAYTESVHKLCLIWKGLFAIPSNTDLSTAVVAEAPLGANFFVLQLV